MRTSEYIKAYQWGDFQILDLQLNKEIIQLYLFQGEEVEELENECLIRTEWTEVREKLSVDVTEVP